MTHYAPRTQSIQCRPHTEAGHTHFDVRLQAPTRAATPVKLWASCDADRDMHRASERDHGHDGHRDGGHDGRCHVSYDDGHSFHPVEHQVAQVPAGCSGFRVRVEHGSRHADVWDLNTQVHGRVSHCRGVPHEDREDHDRHQDHDRPQHPGSRDRHDDDEREGRHHDGRDHEREGRDGHDHDDHHRGDRHHGGRHGHGGDHDDDGGSPPPPRDPAVTCVSGGHAHEGEAVGFEVRLDAPADVTTRVTLALESLTADIASDLVPGSMQASFDNGATWVAVSDDAVDVPAGASGFRVRVATVDDAVHEGAESFRLVASAGGGSASAIGSICDNDGAPRVASVASARADEGDPLDFVVNLDHASTSAVEVALQLANGSATGGQDYAVDGLQVSFDGGQSFTPLAGMQVSVPAGTERFVVRVGGIDDVVDEQDEVFTLQASANGGTAQGIGTICDDDASVRVASVSAAQASEGDPLVFSVGLDGASASETVVQLQLADGTATGGQDYATTGLEVSFDGGATYVAIAGTSVTVPAGATGFKVKVPGIEDEVFEGHETFTLQASTNGSTAQGIGTICEDDSTLRVLSVTGQDVVEGENLVFRVDLESSRAIKPPGSCCPPEEWTCTSGGGKGTIDLGDYKIELVEQGSRWILTNKESGAVTRIWGDPHVDVGNDGKNDFDFKHDMSFQLADGTKITVETVPWGSNGMTLSSKLTITDWCNKNAMVVSGLGSSNDGANNLQVEKFDGEGRALDLSTPDGSFTLYENGLDGWSIFDGRVATQSLVNQLEAGTLSDPLSVVTLTLSDGTAVSPADYEGKLEVSMDDGKTWTLLDANQVNVPSHVTGFLVRIPTIDDLEVESRETLTLRAAARDGFADGEGGILDNDVAPPKVVSVCGAHANEGDPLVFNVGMSGTSPTDTVVQLQLADGTATGGQDYATSGLEVSFDGGATYVAITGTSVTVPAGASGFKLKVPSIEDSVHEPTETFTLQASANGGSAQGIGTICDDDAAVRVVSVSSAQADEGEPLVFAVGLDGTAATDTVVQLQLADGTATGGQDYATTGLEVSFDGGATYVAIAGTSVTVPAGTTGFKVKVPGIEDSVYEGNETFTLQASTNGSSAQGIGTICEDDSAVRVASVSSAHAHEGDPLVFTVGLDGTSATDTIVQLQLADGTATGGQDYATTGLEVSFDGGATYVAIAGTSVTVPAGAAGFKVKVPGIEDEVHEGSETFTLQASANGGSAQGIGTICDDDAAVRVVSVSSAQADEGEPLVFAVGLDGTAATDTIVQLQLADGTATGGQDYATTGLEVSFDGGATYVAISGTSVTVPAGATGFKVKVPGIEDSVYEGNETFTLQASTNGSSAQGIGTICDDDAAVRVVSVSSAQADEGDPLVFSVGLDGAAATDTVVQLQLSDGTATGGQDYATTGLEVSFDGGATYVPISGTSVTVPAGATGFQVKVPGIEDSVYEGNETFTLQASTNGSSAQGIGTICEDDSAVRVASVSPAQAHEGDPLVFTVGLDGTATTDTIVQLQLADGTATGGQDYATTGLEVSFDGGTTFVAISGTSVTVPAGASSFQVKVPGIEDSVFEGSEVFTLQASANGSSAQALGTILDDEAPVRVASVSNAQADEGDPLVFSVGLDGTSDIGTLVQLQLTDGTATGGMDYATTGLEVSFDGGATYVSITGTSVTVPAGVTGFLVKVPGIEDALREGDETFTLQASTGGASAQGIGTIVDDDPGYDPNDVTICGTDHVVEGQPAVGFTIRLAAPVTEDTWVSVRVVDQSAHRTGDIATGQEYYPDDVAAATGRANVNDLVRDFTVFDANGNAEQDDIVQVLVRAGQTESDAFTVQAWQELQRYRQNGDSIEGDEGFRLEVVDVGGTTLAGPSGVNVTVVDQHLTRISPIIIDLDGDGVETVSIDTSAARFDMDLDGTADRTSWVGRDDGLLVHDADGDGIVDDRSELFGGEQGEGFAKLDAFDSNRDGVVDATDERYDELRIWQDRDGDGTTDAGELITLGEAGIAALRTDFELRPEEQNGNLLLERGEVMFNDGRLAEMADAYFSVQSGADGESLPMPKLEDVLSDAAEDVVPLPALSGVSIAGISQGASDAPAALDGMSDGLADLENLMHKSATPGE